MTPDIFSVPQDFLWHKEKGKPLFFYFPTSYAYIQWHWCFGAVSVKYSFSEGKSSSINLFCDCCPMVRLQDRADVFPLFRFYSL